MKNLTLYFLIISLIGISLFSNTLDILEKPPTSMHIWRQADCLSLTKNYSENLSFFEPSIHNYISEGRTSGKTVGEFPILYYSVGAIWKYFGESVYFYRLLGLLFFSLGVVYLYRTILNLTNSEFWSYCISLLFFSSPVLFYYSLNFLTNVYALSCVLIAFYYVLNYLEKEKLVSLIAFSFFFLIAGLLKVTALISLIALISGIAINAIIKRKLIKSHLKIFISFISIAILIFLWFYWAESYNTKYGGKYTFNSIWPIWEMSKESLENAITFSKEFIYVQMFNSITWTIIWLTFIMLIIKIRTKKVVISSLIILFLGCLSYSILWFSAFDAHDYYIINLMIFPLATLVIGIYYVKQYYPQLLQNKHLKVGASLLIVYNVIFLSTNIHVRYEDKLWNDDVASNFFISSYEKEVWKGQYWISKQFRGLERMVEYNRSIGIKPEDLIIFQPDGTFNASLFLLEQKGWTSFGGNYAFNEEGIKQKIDLNAKYLIIGNKHHKEKPYLQSFLHTKIGEFEGREIYQLQ